jgi:WD40 repeat protein/TPR repeat protein
MADVFISYSRKDKGFVRQLDEALKRRKREAWIDWEGIRPTEEFMQAIYRAIEAADTFIFVLTPDSVASVVCGREIAHAAAHNKRLVPLVLCDVDAGKVPEALAKLNWIFCRDSDDFEKAVDTLITALDTDLEWVHAHTRLLTRAIEWETRGKNNSFVLRGVDLRAAEQWLAQAGTDKERQPTALQTEYIIASRKGAAMRQRITLGAVSFGLVIAIILALVALFARQEAVKQRDIAVTQQKMSASRELAAISQTQLQIDPELSVLLGIEAVQRSPTTEAESALRQAVLRSHLLRTLGSHEENVMSAFFSPDGKHLLTIGKDARLWNPATGEGISDIPEEGGFHSASFSSQGNLFVLLSSGTVRLCDASSGRTIKAIRDAKASAMSAAFASDGVVVASAAGSVGRVWQMNSKKTLCELRGHKGEISNAVLSPNAAWVLTQAKDDTARLWETATGRNVSTWNSPDNEGWGGTFSPDSTLLVHGAPDYTAVIRNVTTGKIISELHGHKGGIKHYEFSRDNKFVVTACFDGAARVWEAATGRLVVELRAVSKLVDHASFSPDGKFVVTSDFDNAARIWQLATGDAVAVLRAPDTFQSAIFSPDGASVVSVGDKGVRVWRVPRRLELRGHTDILSHIAWSPDGTSLVTAAGRDTVPRVWDAATGKQLSELHGHTDAVGEAVFSPDGQHIVTASADHTARVWNAFSGECLHVLAGHTDGVWSAAFSPNGLLVVTASLDKTARVWNATSGACVHELRGHSAGVAFSPNVKFFVTADSDSTARLWDTATGKPVAELKGHEKGIHCVAFSPNGKLLVTASQDHTARVWDVGLARSTAVLRSDDDRDRVFTAVFSPDSRLVLTTAWPYSTTPLIFDAERGQELIALRGHSGELTSASFSPDGRFVLTSADDQKAIVWDAATGNQVMQLGGFQRGVNLAAFSPNGRMIATAGWDPADQLPIYSSAQIVDAEVCCPLAELLVLASHRVTRSLTSAERVTYLHEPAGQSESNKPSPERRQSNAVTSQPQTNHQSALVQKPASSSIPLDSAKAFVSAVAPRPTPNAGTLNLPSPKPSQSEKVSDQQIRTANERVFASQAADWLTEAKRYLDAKHYANALPLLQKAADASNADAMNNLGSLYEKGLGVTQDYAQARKWYQQAVEAGKAEAKEALSRLTSMVKTMREYGSDYEHRTPPDYANARFWYQKAADAGDAKAKEALSRVASGTVAAEPQGAAVSGAVETMLGYAKSYEHRSPPDYAQARFWYQKAADVGNAAAKQALSRLPSNAPASGTWPINQPSPSAAPSSADRLAEAKRYLEAKHYAEALPPLRAAADAGNAEAMNRLGDLYYHGHGVTQDYAMARQLYERAAETGETAAMSHLGWLFDKGLGVEQNPTKALYWYQKAVEAGDPGASYDVRRLQHQLNSP